MKKKTKIVEAEPERVELKVGDKVKYKGKEYTIVQLYDFGLATIENADTRLLVQYEDLKAEA